MLETDELQEPTSLPTAVPSTPDLTRHQLEAIRDEWLGPLLMQMRHQSEEVGRLEMQCRQLRDERDKLAAERDQLRERLETQAEPEPGHVSEQTTVETLKDLAGHLQTTEGAMVTGIAIAISLWIGIGLLTWIALG